MEPATELQCFPGLTFPVQFTLLTPISACSLLCQWKERRACMPLRSVHELQLLSAGISWE